MFIMKFTILEVDSALCRTKLHDFLKILNMNMKTKTFSNHGAFEGIAITSITIGHFL